MSRQKDILDEIMLSLEKDRTEERGAELEKQHGYAERQTSELLARHGELHDIWMNFDLESLDTPENRRVNDEYSPLNTYFHTPQGLARRNAHLDELRLQVRAWKPIQKWIGSLVRVITPFEETRSLSPSVGSIGRVIGQELKLWDTRYDIKVYPMIWVEFLYPVTTTSGGLVVHHDEYKALSKEDCLLLYKVGGFNEIWSGREGEQGLTVGYREEEIELAVE